MLAENVALCGHERSIDEAVRRRPAISRITNPVVRREIPLRALSSVDKVAYRGEWLREENAIFATGLRFSGAITRVSILA